MKVDDHDRSLFATTGVLKLKQRIAKNRTEPAQKAILRELARLGLLVNGKWHLKKLESVPHFQLTNKIGQKIGHQAEFDQVIPPELVACANDLAREKFDFATTDATTKPDTKFPFKADKDVSIAESAIVPTLCIFAATPVQACLGFGWSQLIVKGSENEQSYGAFRSDLRVGHYLGGGFIGGIEAHINTVEQEVAGDKSKFDAIAYQAALGWAW